MRICFFGDSFVNGLGDEDALGWVGRVVARLGRDITAYNLGIRGDTSEAIEARWRAEAERRLDPEDRPRLLFAFGANDCLIREGALRVPKERSLAALRRILAEAEQLAPTLVVGPIPVLDDKDADRRIADLSAAQESLCRATGIPFIAVESHIASCGIWVAGAAAKDGTHPDGKGYAALADFVLASPLLHRWLG